MFTFSYSKNIKFAFFCARKKIMEQPRLVLIHRTLKCQPFGCVMLPTVYITNIMGPLRSLQFIQTQYKNKLRDEIRVHCFIFCRAERIQNQ